MSKLRSVLKSNKTLSKVDLRTKKISIPNKGVSFDSEDDLDDAEDLDEHVTYIDDDDDDDIEEIGYDEDMDEDDDMDIDVDYADFEHEMEDRIAGLVDDTSLADLESQLAMIDQVDTAIFKVEKTDEKKTAEDLKAIHVSNQNRLYQQSLVTRMSLQQPLTLIQRVPADSKLTNFTRFHCSNDGEISIKDNALAEIDSDDLISHPIYKKLCISSAVTAQTLGDLITLERSLTDIAGSVSTSKSTTISFDLPHLLTGLTAKARVKYEEDESDYPNKRRRLSKIDQDLEDIEEYLAESWKTSETVRNKTMDKWYKRVQVATGKSNLASGMELSSLNRPLSVQCQQNFDVEGERYIQRSRLRRVTQRALGVPPLNLTNKGDGDDMMDLELVAQKEREARFDTNIYDDNDLYSTLLKDLSALGGDNISGLAESLRAHESNLKKNIKMVSNNGNNTRKGRKLKFEVLPKLANFMVPILTPQWIAACATSSGSVNSTDSLLGVASGQEMLIDELLQGLFGQSERQEKGEFGEESENEDDDEDEEEEEDHENDFEEVDPDDEDDEDEEIGDDFENDGGDFSWFK